MSHTHTFLFALALLPAGILQAQDETPSRAAATTTTATVQNDAILATWLHVASSNEVTLAGIARKQGQSPEVRAFAQKMLDDHTAFAAKLQPFTTAVGPGVVKEGREGREGKEHGKPESRDASKGKNPTDASSPRANAAVAGFDHAALIHDLGKKCLESETKMLSSKSGVEFDRCYMRMMVASHVRGADMVEVFRTYASANLVPTLEAGQTTIAAHLEHAKTLCKQVDTTVADGSDNGDSKGPKNGR